MKVSKSNLIWGIAAVVFSSSSSVLASELEDSQLEVSPQSVQPIILSTTSLIDQSNLFLSPAFEFKPKQFDYSISIEDKNYVSNLLKQEPWKLSVDSSITNPDFVNKQVAALKKKPFSSDDLDEDITIGQHDTFWAANSKQKYWGLTTVKTWGSTANVNSPTVKRRSTNSSTLLNFA